MVDVEGLGASRGPAALPAREVRRLCVLAAARMGVERAHVAVDFGDAERIAQLNGEHRDKPVPTDVLSFPIDGLAARSPTGVPVELGDVVICAEHTADVR